MSNIKKIILIILFIFPIICFADTDCDLKTKSQYSKLAKNVTASYDIVTEGETRYISIKVYNIVEGLQVSYKAGKTTKNSSSRYTDGFGFIASYDTTDGVYEIKHYDIENVYKYKFTINAAANCSGSLKSFTLTIPMYNKYSELDECQYYDVQDYLYCQQWINTPINYNEATVIDRINKQRENYHKSTTTTTIVLNNDPLEARYKKLVRLRILAIIGLSIGILVDIIYIILYIPKLKDLNRFDIEF